MQSLNGKLFFGLTIAAMLLGGALWAHETHDHDKGGFLGVGLTEETEDPEGGARVTFVVDGSPAAEAGIRKGDIIQQIDRRVIHGPNAMVDSIRSTEAGERVTITLQRDGGKEVVDVELGDRSEQVRAFAPRVHDPGKWEQFGREMQERFQSHGRAFAFRSHKPRLGVQLVEVTPELRRHLGAEEEAGVLVAKVIEGMPAAASGIEVGDLIVSADGEEIARTPDLVKVLHDRVGESFPIGVYRDGRLQSVDVSLPEDEDDDVSPGGRACFVPRVPHAPAWVLPEVPMLELPTYHIRVAPPALPPEPPLLEMPPAPVAPISRTQDDV